MLANIEPRGDPTDPTTWIWNLLVNIKNYSSIAKFSKSQKSFLDIPLTKVSGVWKNLFTHISVFSSNGMLVSKHQDPN